MLTDVDCPFPPSMHVNVSLSLLPPLLLLQTSQHSCIQHIFSTILQITQRFAPFSQHGILLSP